MEHSRRTGIGFALILIVIGTWLLMIQLMPQLASAMFNEFFWPAFIILLGVILLVQALFRR